MARCTRVLLSCLLIATAFKASCALDPLEDPTLEIIRSEDQEEADPVYNKDAGLLGGYRDRKRFLDKLVCKEVTADTNTVTVLEGNPPHLYAKVHVQCNDGLVFSSHPDLMSVNVTCDPAPHPCMCIAIWESTVANVMYDFNCTDTLTCEEVHADSNIVTVLEGNPPHLNSKVHVQCKDGLVFKTHHELTSVNATCLPAPHPCMCIAVWETIVANIMHDFNCTENFHCWDPKTSSNIVTELSGTDYHLSSVINIKCADPGTAFSTGSTDLNATCVPTPHPCMCLGYWNVHGDYNLRDFTCTEPASTTTTTVTFANNLEPDATPSNSASYQATGDENTIDEVPNSRYNVIGVKLKDDDTELQPLEATGENEINWGTQRRDMVGESTNSRELEPNIEQGPEEPFVNLIDKELTENNKETEEEHVNNDTEGQEQGVVTEENEEGEESIHVAEHVQLGETEETREEETTEHMTSEEAEEAESYSSEPENLTGEEVTTGIEQEEPGPIVQPQLGEEYVEDEEREPKYYDDEHPIYPQGYEIYNEEEEEETQPNVEQNEEEETETEFHQESDGESDFENKYEANEIEKTEHEESSEEETHTDATSSNTNINYETELEEFEPEEDVEDPHYANNQIPEEENVEEVETTYPQEENEELSNEIVPSSEDDEELTHKTDPSSEETEEQTTDVEPSTEETEELTNQIEPSTAETNEIEPSTEETDFEVPRIFEYQPHDQIKRPSIILDALLDPIDKYQQKQGQGESEGEEEELEVDGTLEDTADVEAPGWFMDVQLEPVRESPDYVSLPEYTDTCSLPPATGLCKAALVRYYYNSNSGECHTFVYGGCNGNRNNFETLEDCLNKCVQDTHS